MNEFTIEKIEEQKISKHTTDIRQQIQNMRDNGISQKEICEYIKEQSFNYKPTIEEYREVLDFRARFYQYSMGNNAMIKMQNPYASYVGSYKHFKDMGYNVKSGEHGMLIKVPKPVAMVETKNGWERLSAVDEQTKQAAQKGELKVCDKIYYGHGYVFDISQTTCPREELPSFLQPTTEKVNQDDFYNALKTEIKKAGLQFVEKDLKSVVLNGYYDPKNETITINDQLNTTDKLQTATHEYAHALLHHSIRKDDGITKAMCEFEAESCAYITLKQAGFDMTDYKFRYISTHIRSMTEKQITKSLGRIDKCSKYMTDKLGSRLGVNFSPEQIHINNGRSPQANKTTQSAPKINTEPPAPPPISVGS